MMLTLKLVLLLLQTCTCIVLGQGTTEPQVPPSLIAPPKGSFYRPLLGGTEYFRGDVMLFCKSNGDNLKYSWFVDEESLNVQANHIKWSPQKGELFINNTIKPVQTGHYQCKVEKPKYGKAISYVTEVKLAKLTYPPLPPPVSIRANIGSAQTLRCDTSKSTIVPSAVYDWQLLVSQTSTAPPKSVTPDERIQIDDEGGLNFAYVIDDDHQNGYYYRCHLVNSEDNSQETSLSYTRMNVTSTTETPAELNLQFSSPIVYGLVGKEANLRCFFSGARDIRITWSYNGQPRNFDRFHEILPSGSTLNIENLKQEDEGEYTCTGYSPKSGFPIKVAKVRLIVHALPIFTEGAPRDVNASVGDSITMSCNTYANPPATVTWLRNGEKINENPYPKKLSINKMANTLTVNQLCKDCGDEGDISVIQCIANNTNGTLLGQGYINVFERTIIEEGPYDIILGDQDTINFTCRAKTDPTTKLTYTWTLNDEEIADGRIDTTIPGLVVIDIQNSENKGQKFLGKWTCIASNGISRDMQEATLSLPPVSAFVPLVIVFCLLLIILIIILILCCIYYNRGDMYPVDQKERWGGNNPEKELIDSGFHDYQRPLMIDDHHPSYSE